MKKLLLSIALFAFNLSNSQTNVTVDTANIKYLTIDVVYSGSDLEITATPLTALGTGGTATVTGNLTNGRIDITTGVGGYGKTPCRINLPTGLNTDNVTVFLQSYAGEFIQVRPIAVEGNGFEIESKEDWLENSYYQFRYFIISHVQ